MPSLSPIRDGFRATWRVPAVVPAEISWRWAVGGAFWALVVLSFVEYAASLPVSELNWILWKIGYPPLAANAFGATVAGSGYKLLKILAVLVPGVAALWTVAAALGRTATLRAIIGRSVRFRTMLGLNFLRSGLALAALTGFAGIFAIAMQLYSDGPGTVPHAARASWIWLLGWGLVAYLWKTMDWFLSLAFVVAAEQNCDVIAALAGSVRAFGDHTGRFFGINLAFGGLHFLTFCVFVVIAFFPLMLAAAVPGKVVLALLCLIALAYFAVVDFLYIARLGAYVALAE